MWWQNVYFFSFVSLCIFIVIDVVSGVLKALTVDGTLDSSTMRRGAYHKASEILLWIFCFALEVVNYKIDLGITVPLVEGITVYLILMEAVSIYENIKEINPDINFSFDFFKKKE